MVGAFLLFSSLHQMKGLPTPANRTETKRTPNLYSILKRFVERKLSAAI